VLIKCTLLTSLGIVISENKPFREALPISFSLFRWYQCRRHIVFLCDVAVDRVGPATVEESSLDKVVVKSAPDEFYS
jgi:hypothetical protein